MNTTYLPTLENLRGYPPRLVELRRRYDEIKAAYDAASEHEDESGEEIPIDLRRAESRAFRQLGAEEARAATLAKTTGH